MYSVFKLTYIYKETYIDDEFENTRKAGQYNKTNTFCKNWKSVSLSLFYLYLRTYICVDRKMAISFYSESIHKMYEPASFKLF